MSATVGLASLRRRPCRVGIRCALASRRLPQPRTAALPFLFIFNTDLLLIDVTVMQGILVFIVATIAMLIFAAGTQL